MRLLMILILAVAGMGLLPAFAAQQQTNAAINECKRPTLIANGLTEDTARLIEPGKVIEVLCPSGDSRLLSMPKHGTVWGLIDVMLSSPPAVAATVPPEAPSTTAPVVPTAAKSAATYAAPVPGMTIAEPAVASTEAPPAPAMRDVVPLWAYIVFALFIVALIVVVVLAVRRLARQFREESAAREAAFTREVAEGTEREAALANEIAQLRLERDSAIAEAAHHARTAFNTELIAKRRLNEIEALKALATTTSDVSASPTATAPSATRHIVECQMSSGVMVDIPFTLTGERNESPEGRIVEFAQGPWEHKAQHVLFITKPGKKRAFAADKLLRVLNKMPDYLADWIRANGRVRGTPDIQEVWLKPEPATNVMTLPVRQPLAAAG